MGEPAQAEEEDGPLEDWTKKELAEECKTLGLSDKGTKAVLIARIKEARAATAEPAVEEPAVEEASTEELPMEAAPAEESTVEEAPSEEVPVEEVPVEEAPIEEAPVVEAPVEETPVEETPVEEAPVEEAAVEEAPVEEAAIEDPVAEEAVAQDSGNEEAAVDSDNDSEVTFPTTSRLSSRLDVASITALMAKNEVGKLSQQQFYRVFLMTVQSGLTANQRLEDLETRMAAAEGKINNEPAAPAVAEAAVEPPAVEEEAAAVEEAVAVEEA